MKQTFTISLDEELVSHIRRISFEKRDIFRNKSHFVEFAVQKFVEELKDVE